jgi:hypothetical protein
MHRTPKDLIQLYWDEVWNNGRAELIREICADPLIRYDIGGAATNLSHAEQIARVTSNVEKMHPHFTHEVLLADDTHVASVWNMTTPLGPEYSMCGIEVFRAEQGRFVACWNAPYAKGRWGRDGDPSIALHLAPPEMVMSADEITPDWVQRVLKVSSTPAPRVASIIDVNPVGNGTTAQTKRVRISYNGDPGAAPQTLIVKMPAADPAVLRNMSDQGIYACEIAAYRFFANEPGFRRPKIYFAEAANNGVFNLVMEDLSDWTPGDQIAGCSAKEAEAVVRECTALHLRYWDDPALAKLDWPRRMSAIAAPFANMFATGAGIMRSNYSNVLGQDLDIIDRVTPLIEPFFARPLDQSTLIHGDLRVDNVLFKYTAADQVEACLVDFQVAAVGDPLFDLAYFLTGSVAPGERREHERRLVAEHALAIRSADRSYDLDAAWDRYRAHSIVGLAATVVAAAVIGRNEYIDRLLVTLARRNCAAIRDLDGLAQARKFTEFRHPPG